MHGSSEVAAYIGLGSNVGDRQACIRAALERLHSTPGISRTAVSSTIETPPLGRSDQPPYLNAVAAITTTLPAERLLGTLQEIESSLGRERAEHWGPRTIDLDLILYGSEVIHTPHLTVPHPQMHLRSFVLRGLCELDGNLVHPLLHRTVGTLAERLGGADFALDPGRPQLICVAGIVGVGKTTLARALASVFACPTIAEAYDTNPYLPHVYAGRKDLALQSQLYFLNSRIEQLGKDRLPAGRVVTADYVFEKDRIYARRTLNPEQLAEYERYSPTAQDRVAEPVLTIYLTDTPQRCLERIRLRNRPYEQGIPAAWLDAFARDFDDLFARWRKSPLIRLDASQFDPRKDEQVRELAREVRYYVAAGDEP